MDGKIATINANLNVSIPFDDESVDIITSMAIIEHLENPERYVQECYRILKPQGFMILTVPSPLAKPILEFMVYKLKI